MTSSSDPIEDASSGERFKGELCRIRRNPLVLMAAAAPALLALIALVAAVTVKATYAAFVFHPLILSCVLLLLAWRRNPWSRREVVRVLSSRLGISAGKTRIHRDELQDGFVIPGHRVRVQLNTKGISPGLEFEVEDVDEGRHLLRSLGLDASQTVARVKAMSRVFASRWHVAVLALGLPILSILGGTALGGGHSYPAASAIGFFAPILLFALLALVKSRLSIGADGLEVRWLGWRRFVRYKDLVDASVYVGGFGNSKHSGVELVLEGGETVRIPIGQRRFDDDRVKAVVERIRESKEIEREGNVESDAALLARGDREIAAWSAALRGIGAGANVTMRVAPIARERLFRIVEDPAAEPVARAAAAVALTGEADQPTRDRLRAAAEATAGTHLRIAFEAAADEDPSAVDEALGVIDAEHQRARVR